MARFKKKIVVSSRIGNFLTQNNQKTRIPRWLGRENEENVATRNCCGRFFTDITINSLYIELDILINCKNCLQGRTQKKNLGGNFVLPPPPGAPRGVKF